MQAPYAWGKGPYYRTVTVVYTRDSHTGAWLEPVLDAVTECYGSGLIV